MRTVVPWGGRPTGARRRAQILRCCDRAEAGLGGAVEVVEDVAEGVGDFAGKPDAQRRGGRDHDTQRRRVIATADLIGKLEDPP
jgi:hypothetical protein